MWSKICEKYFKWHSTQQCHKLLCCNNIWLSSISFYYLIVSSKKFFNVSTEIKAFINIHPKCSAFHCHPVITTHVQKCSHRQDFPLYWVYIYKRLPSYSCYSQALCPTFLLECQQVYKILLLRRYRPAWYCNLNHIQQFLKKT